MLRHLSLLVIMLLLGCTTIPEECDQYELGSTHMDECKTFVREYNAGLVRIDYDICRAWFKTQLDRPWVTWKGTGTHDRNGYPRSSMTMRHEMSKNGCSVPR